MEDGESEEVESARVEEDSERLGRELPRLSRKEPIHHKSRVRKEQTRRAVIIFYTEASVLGGYCLAIMQSDCFNINDKLEYLPIT